MHSNSHSIAVVGMLGEAAARCSWRVKDAPKARYDIPHASWLLDAQSPAEMLAIASKWGYKSNHLHITDVLGEWPVRELAKVETDQLRRAVEWLSDDCSKLIVLKTDEEGLIISGVALGRWAAHPATSLVFRSPHLKRVFSALPSGHQADVGLLEHKGEEKAIRILIEGWPREEYYVPIARCSLSEFVL